MVALDGDIAAHPEDGSRLDPLPLGGEPDGVAAIVLRVGARLLVAERVDLARLAHDKVVVDDAVVVGHQPCGQGIVVGERLAGERRCHHRLDPVVRHLVEKGSVERLGVVPPEAVERNNHGVVVAAHGPAGQGHQCHAECEIEFFHCCCVLCEPVARNTLTKLHKKGDRAKFFRHGR